MSSTDLTSLTNSPDTASFDKRVKTVCTIGPSSWDENVMKEMIVAGMTIARLNGAFADREEMVKVEKLVRKFSDKVGLMIDIKGPEVRLNKFETPIQLSVGQQLKFGSDDSAELYPVNYPDTYKKLNVGQEILVGDGDVKFVVTEILEDGFMAEVVYGQLLKPGKALNFPGAQLHDSPITEKDRDLLEYAIERNWDYVSASFIRTAEDGNRVREEIKEMQTKFNGNDLQIVAKIEDQAGVDNIAEIMPTIEGIMIARGGLGVDMGLENIPVAEYKLLQASLEYGKPAIVATQMLDSMERNSFPTRAEANDVGMAILHGADAVMTSGETTAGDHPVAAVQFMKKVDSAVSEITKVNTELKFTLPTDADKIAAEKASEIFKKIFEAETDSGIVVINLTDSINVRSLEFLAKYNVNQKLIVISDDLSALRNLQIVGGINAVMTQSEFAEISDKLGDFLEIS